jgi:hypothetical protein
MPCRPTNDDALRAFRDHVIRLRRPLRRRSQKDRMPWERIERGVHPALHPLLHLPVIALAFLAEMRQLKRRSRHMVSPFTPRSGQGGRLVSTRSRHLSSHHHT